MEEKFGRFFENMKGKLKKFWENLKGLNWKDFFRRVTKGLEYPQYSIFLIEVIYLIACAIMTFIYNRFNHIESYLILIGLFFLSFYLFVARWKNNYDFRRIFKPDDIQTSTFREFLKNNSLSAC